MNKNKALLGFCRNRIPDGYILHYEESGRLVRRDKFRTEESKKEKARVASAEWRLNFLFYGNMDLFKVN